MELIKQNIHMNKLLCKSSLQMTLDDDFNVPDTKPDVSSLITTGGEIKFSEQKIMNGKLYVNGSLIFTVLYLSEETGRPIHSINGQIPFNEVVNLNEDCDQDSANVKYEIEDLTTNIINSRKLGIKSLVSVYVSVDEVYDEECAVSVDDSSRIQSVSKKIDVTNMVVNKKDSYRFRDEVILPSGKRNVSEILYSDVDLKNVDVRLFSEKFTIKGELLVFLLFIGEGDENPVEYYETELPFSSTIECNGCSEDMTPDITLSLVSKNLEVKPDADGEERLIDVETVIDVNVKVYEETQIEVLKDLYSPNVEIEPVFKEATYENLVMRNSNKARITDRLKISEGNPKILQICHGNGTVKVDEVVPAENGLEIDGVLNLNILYITSEDEAPLQSLSASIPFSQAIEIKNLQPSSNYDVKASLEQISIMMLDTDEVEVKASVVFNVIAFNELTEAILIDYNESPLDLEKLQEMPGMIGYVVKAGDTLWNIAKKYHTTIDAIMEVNDLESDLIYPGDHLLIVKDIGPVLMN